MPGVLLVDLEQLALLVDDEDRLVEPRVVADGRSERCTTPSLRSCFWTRLSVRSGPGLIVARGRGRCRGRRRSDRRHLDVAGAPGQAGLRAAGSMPGSPPLPTWCVHSRPSQYPVLVASRRSGYRPEPTCSCADAIPASLLPGVKTDSVPTVAAGTYDRAHAAAPPPAGGYVDKPPRWLWMLPSSRWVCCPLSRRSPSPRRRRPGRRGHGQSALRATWLLGFMLVGTDESDSVVLRHRPGALLRCVDRRRRLRSRHGRGPLASQGELRGDGPSSASAIRRQRRCCRGSAGQSRQARGGPRHCEARSRGWLGSCGSADPICHVSTTTEGWSTSTAAPAEVLRAVARAHLCRVRRRWWKRVRS